MSNTEHRGASAAPPVPTRRIHRVVTLTLQAILVAGAVLAALEGRWLVMLGTVAIVAITLLPIVAGKHFGVQIPPEFEALAIVFVYASLFLGEIRGYYVRFWWWDALLHTGSGLLLGVLGFLLVHVLNEKESIDLHMTPAFVALFAFMFAVGFGALWGIFEFAMDQLFGLNMQKSGLIDTMWDLIVDTVGAAIIAVLGFTYFKSGQRDSFLEHWIANFVAANPRLFGTHSTR